MNLQDGQLLKPNRHKNGEFTISVKFKQEDVSKAMQEQIWNWWEEDTLVALDNFRPCEQSNPTAKGPSPYLGIRMHLWNEGGDERIQEWKKKREVEHIRDAFTCDKEAQYELDRMKGVSPEQLNNFF